MLVVPDALATARGIIRQVYERNGHFKYAKIEAVLKAEYDINKLEEQI